MDVLRTPDEAFADLPGYDFEPHYTEIDDQDGGTLRVHHVDEGPADAAETVLLMHGDLSTSCADSALCVVPRSLKPASTRLPEQNGHPLPPALERSETTASHT